MAQSKIHDNAAAAYETQPVSTAGMAQNTDGDKVDMKKVRDIRWVLKRRYLKSRNFQRIFNYWDMEHKGFISAQNVYDMCKRLGINVNPRECEVVIATADRKGNGLLGPDEFLDLIYNHVVLDIDTSKAKSSNIIDGPDVEQLKKQLNDQAKKSREQKHYNQVKYVLKSHLKDLQKDFGRSDIDGTGQINQYNFERVLKGMNISEQVMGAADIGQLYKAYAKDHNNKIDYRSFVEDIQNTIFEADNIYSTNHPSLKPEKRETPNNALESQRNALFVKKLRDMDRIMEDISFLDNKKMDAHNLGLLARKMTKIRRFLSNYFPEEQQFVEFLSKSIGVPPASFDKANIAQVDFKRVIDGLLDRVEQKMDRRMLEGFFANFTYNTRGQINAKDIVDTLFHENEKDFYVRVMKRPKGPSPGLNENSQAGIVQLPEEEMQLRKYIQD